MDNTHAPEASTGYQEPSEPVTAISWLELLGRVKWDYSSAQLVSVAG